MPRRKRRRSRRRGSFRPTVSYQPTRVTADSTITKLVYGFSNIIQPGVITTRRRFRGNDVFLPNPAQSSQQPIGFDQWAGLYKRYEVLASSVKTRCINLDTAGPIQWCVYPAFDTIDISFNSAIAQPYSKRGFCDTLGSGSTLSQINHYMTTAKLLGRPPLGDSYQALTATSPTKTWEWIFEFTNPEGSLPLEFELASNITYYVRFFERKALINTL